jgi:hypothetical protein
VSEGGRENRRQTNNEGEIALSHSVKLPSCCKICLEPVRIDYQPVRLGTDSESIRTGSKPVANGSTGRCGESQFIGRLSFFCNWCVSTLKNGSFLVAHLFLRGT